MMTLEAVRRPSLEMGARIRLAAMVVALALTGCRGTPGERAADDGATQSVPSTMLEDGGTKAVPSATEFPVSELGFDRGEADAPITILEFSDFGCGYCKRFHADTYPVLKEKWIDAGVVQWKYVTYVSGMFANGLPAAFAAECTGEQGRFEPMREVLYERQQEWKGAGDPHPIFERYAEEAGVGDLDRYRACVSEERPRSRIRSGVLAGARLGVRGTPSFLIDGFPLVGAQPIQLWNDIIAARMAELEQEAAGP